MSLSALSSARGVGFVVNARLFPSGDHWGSLAAISPAASRRAFFVARSSTQRRLNL